MFYKNCNFNVYIVHSELFCVLNATWELQLLKKVSSFLDQRLGNCCLSRTVVWSSFPWIHGFMWALLSNTIDLTLILPCQLCLMSQIAKPEQVAQASLGSQVGYAGDPQGSARQQESRTSLWNSNQKQLCKHLPFTTTVFWDCAVFTGVFQGQNKKHCSVIIAFFQCFCRFNYKWWVVVGLMKDTTIPPSPTVFCCELLKC